MLFRAATVSRTAQQKAGRLRVVRDCRSFLRPGSRTRALRQARRCVVRVHHEFDVKSVTSSTLPHRADAYHARGPRCADAYGFGACVDIG